MLKSHNDGRAAKLESFQFIALVDMRPRLLPFVMDPNHIVSSSSLGNVTTAQQ